MKCALCCLVVLFAGTPLVACGDDAAEADGSIEDAQSDVIRDVGTDRPGGAVCEPGCTAEQRCCAGADGTPSCVSTLSDSLHCGGCGVSCADGRGTECRAGRCVCGIVDFGCAGDESSFCCPPRSATGVDYCANLLDDGDDCGGCNAPCELERADRCLEGGCSCGLTENPCVGGEESTCCPAALVGDSSCVDLTASTSHCGDCNNNCRVSEECRAGICSFGEGTCDRCEDGESCCFGSCCRVGRCTIDGCTEL